MANLKGKKVLVLNLGLLGGGVATTKWLLDQGARVTVTDLADAKILAPSVKRVEEHLKKVAKDGKDYDVRRGRLTWALGKHSAALVDAADILVVNPSVSVGHPYVQRALKKKIGVANEGTLFYDHFKGRTIGVTGTRGKTTTATWTSHLIRDSLLTGNSVTNPFQSAIATRAPVAVTELSSFILELFDVTKAAPNIAVITNLSGDHLNRHGTMEKYAQAKSALFAHQTAKDVLILNKDDAWTPWFLKQKPRAKILFFSSSSLPDGAPKNILDREVFAHQWGHHNLANLMAAMTAAHASGVPWKKMQPRIATLPQVPLRQQTVYQSRKLRLINDTTATSPEGGIAAVRRWGAPNCILITGGTDRVLDYAGWAVAVREHIRPTNLVFLDGSATLKMRAALGDWAHGVRSYAKLSSAWRAAKKRAGLFVSAVVLFSPAAKSFELFKNEFDRGHQFNELVKKI